MSTENGLLMARVQTRYPKLGKHIPVDEHLLCAMGEVDADGNVYGLPVVTVGVDTANSSFPSQLELHMVEGVVLPLIVQQWTKRIRLWGSCNIGGAPAN